MIIMETYTVKFKFKNKDGYYEQNQQYFYYKNKSGHKNVEKIALEFLNKEYQNVEIISITYC
jgi:hypothetical protein